MNPSHISAQSSHYDTAAEYYDKFNERHSEIINKTIEKILKKYKVKSILDMTCGTGSQVLWLAKQGYRVTGSDISSSMLEIAKRKAKKDKLDVTFLKGDMRTLQVGTFDAVITIFNSVGHLTKQDFEKALSNIRSNLKEGGLYLFDIFNLHYLLHGSNITNLTIDWQAIVDSAKVRDVQYSTIDKDGILTSYTTTYVQKGSSKAEVSQTTQTLQTYTAEQLGDMLHKAGFKVLKQCGFDGSQLSATKTERILTVAQKE